MEFFLHGILRDHECELLVGSVSEALIIFFALQRKGALSLRNMHFAHLSTRASKPAGSGGMHGRRRREGRRAPARLGGLRAGERRDVRTQRFAKTVGKLRHDFGTF